VEQRNCPHQVEVKQLRRPANALCIEWFVVYPVRCLLKRPEHWPDTISSLVWLYSGGEATVFSPCDHGCGKGAVDCTRRVFGGAGRGAAGHGGARQGEARDLSDSKMF